MVSEDEEEEDEEEEEGVLNYAKIISTTPKILNNTHKYLSFIMKFVVNT